MPHPGAISLQQGLWLVPLLPSSPPSQAQMPTVSSPSRAPGLGPLPPRVHGLSTHTSPNLAVLSPTPQLGLLWEGQEESAQRRGDSGLFLGSCRTADNPVL